MRTRVINKVQIKVISNGQLQKGDVILSTTDDFQSTIVKFGTLSKFSHSRLYIGNGHISSTSRS